MFKRVLVGIDHVDAGRKPLWEVLGQLSQGCGSRLTLAHVTEVYPSRFGLHAEGHAQVETLLAEARAEIEACGGIVDRTTEIRVGLSSPAEVLVNLARAEQSDLLVLGSHPHNAWSGAFLGSVSQRVAGHSPCPVLAVPCPE
jgi:nucleotide-binding universal stress UspA family protein